MIVKTGLAVGLLVVAALFPEGAAAAATEGTGWGWLETIGRWFNLLLLLGLVGYFLKDRAILFFRDRREGIRKQKEEAQAARQDSRRKLAAARARIQNLDNEREQIRAQAKIDAEAERQRIIDQADQEAKRILKQAQREIEGLRRTLRRDLKDYAAQLAVELAEEKIRREMSPADEHHAVNRFLGELQSASGN